MWLSVVTRTFALTHALTDDGRRVEAYQQVITGRGATDIGMHLDRQDLHGDGHLHPVDTYFSLARGVKHVVMLPPGPQDLFPDKASFPRVIDVSLAEVIVRRGGFYFTLTPDIRDAPLCLFIPRGWHHWLLGSGAWHVAYGGSRA
jgi:hypothetical protein